MSTSPKCRRAPPPRRRSARCRPRDRPGCPAPTAAALSVPQPASRVADRGRVAVRRAGDARELLGQHQCPRRDLGPPESASSAPTSPPSLPLPPSSTPTRQSPGRVLAAKSVARVGPGAGAGGPDLAGGGSTLGSRPARSADPVVAAPAVRDREPQPYGVEPDRLLAAASYPMPTSSPSGVRPPGRTSSQRPGGSGSPPVCCPDPRLGQPHRRAASTSRSRSRGEMHAAAVPGRGAVERQGYCSAPAGRRRSPSRCAGRSAPGSPARRASRAPDWPRASAPRCPDRSAPPPRCRRRSRCSRRRGCRARSSRPVAAAPVGRSSRCRAGRVARRGDEQAGAGVRVAAHEAVVTDRGHRDRCGMREAGVVGVAPLRVVAGGDDDDGAEPAAAFATSR